MSDVSPQIIGLYRIKLSQRRFRPGALYVSGIYIGGDLDAIDIRYFVEDGSQLIPTRQGFRIHADNLPALRTTLHTQAIDLKEQELWRGATRKLIARYCDDEYGTGVDIRYFSDSTRYRGWEPKGVRLQLEDYSTLRATLLGSGVVDGSVSVKADLFSGKEIVGRTAQSRRNSERSKRPVNKPPSGASQENSSINEALQAYINGL
jgi:hypothetical protein